MKLKLLTTSWFKGGFFHWKEHRFNGGDSYTSYRLGPVLIRVYDKITNEEQFFNKAREVAKKIDNGTYNE